MSAVVLRCPACGTTQNNPGECDACYDDQVRYFCGDHDPGRWLDGPACRDCGARFGEEPRRPAPPPPRTVPAPTRPTTRARASRPPTPSEGRDEWIDRPSPDSDFDPRPSLGALLARLLLARWRAAYGADDGSGRGARPPLSLPTFPLKGCLIRLVWVAVLLFAFGLVALFLLANMLQVVEPVRGF